MAAVPFASTSAQPGKQWWVAWWADPDYGTFSLRDRWWINAARSERLVSIGAIIRAPSAELAQREIYTAYVVPPPRIEFLFCREFD